jgi:multidrug efflux pump subunit AcrB
MEIAMASAIRHAAALALALAAPAAARAETIPDETAFAVTALLAGAAAEDMAARVTAVMETRLGAAPALAFMVSVSSAGTSRVLLKFKPDVAEDEAAPAVEAAIERMRGRLPEAAGVPIVSRMSMLTQPAAYLAFSSDRHSYGELTVMLEPLGRDLLASSADFESLSRYGAHYPMLGLRLDLTRLAANGITVGKIRAALAIAGIDSEPLTKVPGEFAFKLMRGDRLPEPEDVERLTLRNGFGDTVRMRDLGVVALDAISDGLIARFDGRSAVLIELHPRNGISAVDAARAVHRGVQAIAQRLPGGVRHAIGYSCGACDRIARREHR